MRLQDIHQGATEHEEGLKGPLNATKMSHRAICEFTLPGKTVGDLLQVLNPEATGEGGERTSVDLGERDGAFILEVGSKDIKGLRAALNSYLRWIECSLKVTELPKREESD